jgi:hypothetical protein
MKVASLTFVAVLLLAHVQGDPAKVWALPLSMLRDDGRGVLGYVLFAMLLLVGGLMLLALLRAEMHGHVCLFGLLAVVLALVALTPSEGEFHLICSLVLFALLYTYYAVQLHATGGLWFRAHLAVPVLLVLATQFHSYGLWQKSFILYFLLAVNVQYHLLTQASPARAARVGGRRRDGYLPRRRVVHVLDADRSWARDRLPRGRRRGEVCDVS